ncbi:hypothetical protein WJX84_007590 [Apatococcus fuscideae]|uniref:Uncharacterized protein n=1 Tax=Apatococcus fuscideae TaxID=2026836 RepID=A0AAW1T9Z8_9CHLO
MSAASEPSDSLSVKRRASQTVGTIKRLTQVRTALGAMIPKPKKRKASSKEAEIARRQRRSGTSQPDRPLRLRLRCHQGSNDQPTSHSFSVVLTLVNTEEFREAANFANEVSKRVLLDGVEDESSEILANTEATICELLKLIFWMLCYLSLMAAYILCSAVGQPLAGRFILHLVPTRVMMLASLAFNFLAVAGFSCLIWNAAAGLYPLAADPLPLSMQQSYAKFEEEFPSIRVLRISNFVAVLAICTWFAMRVWPY